MKIIKLWGGLGNQLFQYSFGQSLNSLKNEEVFYFLDGLASTDKENSILHLVKDIPLIDKCHLSKYAHFSKNKLLYRFRRKLIQKIPFLNPKVYIEKELYFNDYFPSKAELFDGYWQSYKYINPIEVKLRDKIDFEGNDLYSNMYIDKITNSNSISLHIRRGDYLSKQNMKVYEVCPLSYYYESINKMTEMVDKPVFFIFSNDIPWVKDNLKIPENIKVEFVDNYVKNNSAITDLFLMSNCKHHIIANSTFSWWGAWLNPSNSKIVIAPKKWYVGNLNNTTIDLIPSSWIRI